MRVHAMFKAYRRSHQGLFRSGESVFSIARSHQEDDLDRNFSPEFITDFLNLDIFIVTFDNRITEMFTYMGRHSPVME
jgi:hypothetical protein